MPRAPRQCPASGCDNLITTTKYCPDHTTSWAGTRTTSSSITGTAAWKRVRLEVLKRDKHRCQIQGSRCTGTATQVDHIVNTASGGAHLDPTNLQSACAPCNAQKAQAEGARSRRTKGRI